MRESWIKANQFKYKKIKLRGNFRDGKLISYRSYILWRGGFSSTTYRLESQSPVILLDNWTWLCPPVAHIVPHHSLRSTVLFLSSNWTRESRRECYSPGQASAWLQKMPYTPTDPSQCLSKSHGDRRGERKVIQRRIPDVAWQLLWATNITKGRIMHSKTDWFNQSIHVSIPYLGYQADQYIGWTSNF